MNEDYTVIDPVAIQQNMMQNTELIKQFLDLYLVQIPVDFAGLTKAMSNGQQMDISSKAHHIKPTMEYIGATKLRAALQELETAAKNGANMQTLEQLFIPLEQQFARLLSEISAYLKSL
ncbi:Hpt domain-containing protein [Sphingobacterium paludis]|uniref:HPt (Histidine-containing phosphotransfer) domain-containing protein n=1 Tax=Sphingobacterium paludis TaxID=1476465 RepID=A0A4R7DAA2_9SPHI|nr:Hpt domain-containing protein [Sphingobacterium paludis]TDS17171.1 HPt (histidine-containing phosphotransfer) domain-containing protein [Sphingobacterium paludis]